MPELRQDVSLRRGHRSSIAGFADPEFDNRTALFAVYPIHFESVWSDAPSLLDVSRRKKGEQLQRKDSSWK